MDFSRALALLIASSGMETSMSFLRTVTGFSYGSGSVEIVFQIFPFQPAMVDKQGQNGALGYLEVDGHVLLRLGRMVAGQHCIHRGKRAEQFGGEGEVDPPRASVDAASVVGAAAVGGVPGGDLCGAVAGPG